MRDWAYPGGLGELEFLDGYLNVTLRKPQVAADAALRALVLAPSVDRRLIAGLIAEQLAESCRRLVAVWEALRDRGNTVARQLLQPLPGLDSWRTFSHEAATLSPAQMLRHLAVGEDALASAERLREQPDLTSFDEHVAVAAAPNAMVIAARPGRAGQGVWWSGAQAEADPVSAAVESDERAAAVMADRTADFASIARGFLGSYVGVRRGRGTAG